MERGGTKKASVASATLAWRRWGRYTVVWWGRYTGYTGVATLATPATLWPHCPLPGCIKISMWPNTLHPSTSTFCLLSCSKLSEKTGHTVWDKLDWEQSESVGLRTQCCPRPTQPKGVAGKKCQLHGESILKDWSCCQRNISSARSYSSSLSGVI